MNRLKTIFFFTAFLYQTIGYSQFSKNTDCKVQVVFHTVVGNSPLHLDSSYITPLDDTFSVTKFKFFISHILFTDYSRNQKKIDDYFLIDENDSSTQTVSFHLAIKSFTNLEFTVGVDSAKNFSGVQTGALDPATGMFWTWNSGYIMAKLEGKSPQSKAPFGNITYHIGGFRQNDNVIRKVSLQLPKWPLVSSSSSVVIIELNVDLNKWFDGPHPIKIAEKSFCMSPGKMAMEIADNYANMFSIKSISIK